MSSLEGDFRKNVMTPQWTSDDMPSVSRSVSSYRICGIVFVVALLVRVLALLFLPHLPLDTNATLVYLPGARLLLEGEGFWDPSFSVLAPPLYSVAIAMCSFLFGDGEMGIKALQLVADSLTVVLIYFVVSEVFNSRTAAMASSVWALYPFAIYPTLYVGPESLFTFGLAGTMLATVYGIKTGQWKYYCAAGVLLGFSTLMRGTTQWFPLVLVIILFGLKRFGTRAVICHSAVVLLTFGIVLAPWSLRNHLVLNEVIPVATSGGMVFLWGSKDEFLTIGEREKSLPKAFDAMKNRDITFPSRSSGPSEKERFLFRMGVENYKMRLENDPISLIPFFLKKFARVWYATESGERHMTILMINLSIYALAIVGIVLAYRNGNTLAILLIGLIAYFAALHCATLPLFRYMVPIMPYVIAFAASAMEAARSRALGKYV